MTTTIPITIRVDIPPNSTENPTPGQVSFSLPTDIVHLSPGSPTATLLFTISGTFNDGTPYPTRFLLLRNPGITWYTAETEERGNPWMNPGQKRQLESWLNDPNNTPVVAADAQSASVTIDRSGMSGIIASGQTLKLSFNIGVQVALDAPHPWVRVDHDPEVDIEMDA